MPPSSLWFFFESVNSTIVVFFRFCKYIHKCLTCVPIYETIQLSLSFVLLQVVLCMILNRFQTIHKWLIWQSKRQAQKQLEAAMERESNIAKQNSTPIKCRNVNINSWMMIDIYATARFTCVLWFDYLHKLPKRRGHREWEVTWTSSEIKLHKGESKCVRSLHTYHSSR